MIKKDMFKRIIALGASTVLLSGVTVVANEPRLVKSEGQYAINSEEGNMLLDTDDIEANAEAIAALRAQLGGLSFKYGTEKDVGASDKDDKGYYWSQTPEGEWVKIGAVGNAKPSDVLVGKRFSSESGVDIDGTMPNPTTAPVAQATNPTENLKIGADSQDIKNGTGTLEEHNTDVSEINLGVNEQITMPYGYYNKDVVINNGVSNKGASEVIIDAQHKEVTLPAGYYSSVHITTTLNPIGKVKYKHHVHSITSANEYVETDTATPTTEGLNDNYSTQTAGGCFTTPRYETIYKSVTYKGHLISVGETVIVAGENETWRTYECSKCGHKYRSLGGDDGHTHQEYAGERFLGYFCSCGRTKGQVVEAVIEY